MHALRTRIGRSLGGVAGLLGRELDRFTAKPLGELLAVSSLALIAVGLLVLRTELLSTSHPLFADPGWDHHAYIAMARDNPFDFHLAPFGWRVGLPALIKALPLGLQASFFLLTFLAVTAMLVAFYYVLTAAGYGRQLALVGFGFLLTLGWATKFPLQDFWLPDGVTFLAVTLAMLCILRKQAALFATVVLVGVLVKEAVVFAVPLYYTLQAKRPFEPRLALETSIVAFPAVAALFVLRLAIPARNEDLAYVATLAPNLQAFREFIPSYNYHELLRDIGYHYRLHDFRLETWLLYTTGTWTVPVLTFAVIGTLRTPVLALRLLPFLALVYAQLLFAVNIERLLVVGFPAVLWLAIEGVRHVCHRLELPRAWVLPLPALLFAFQFEHPAAIPVRFEAETFVFLGWLAAVLAITPALRARAGPPSARM